MPPLPKKPSGSKRSNSKRSDSQRSPVDNSLFLLGPVPRRNDRTNRPTPVAPHSTDQGPHRDGYTERKCRFVLVRECSRVPRNFNYIDGLHMVVSILRTHLGDENLDLSLGVLYEFIEVNDTTQTWEEASPFRRWTYDHSMRNHDFCCSHTLRLRNIVVGAVQPTEHLSQWRQRLRIQEANAAESNDSARAAACQSPDISRSGPPSKTHGIRNRHSWQINHSLYVSSPTKGTNVLYCPTPTKLNEMAFNEGVARGQRFHAGTLPSPKPQLVPTTAEFRPNMGPSTPPPTPVTPHPESKPSFFKRSCQAIIKPFRQRRLRKKKSAEEKAGLTTTAESFAINAFDETADKEPEIVNGPTRTYVEEDGTLRVVLESVPLPPNAKVNGVFSRKFGLVDYESQLPAEVERFVMDTAEDKVLKDELALKRYIKLKEGSKIPIQNIVTSHMPFNGPFTADLFKDGGLDFRWKPATATVAEDDADAISPAPAR